MASNPREAVREKRVSLELAALKRVVADLESGTAALLSGPHEYTPTLTASTTNPSLGFLPVVAGWWYRIGRRVYGEARFEFGSGADAGSGHYTVSLPVPADLTFHNADTSVGKGSVVGDVILRDGSSLNSSQPGEAWLIDASSMYMLSPAGRVNASTPWAWVDGDAISVKFTYLEA